jgi:hypothetical protein
LIQINGDRCTEKAIALLNDMVAPNVSDADKRRKNFESAISSIEKRRGWQAQGYYHYNLRNNPGGCLIRQSEVVHKGDLSDGKPLVALINGGWALRCRHLPPI